MKIAICLGLTAALTLASAALAADGPSRPDRDHRGRAERADANGDGAVTLQESQAALRERLMRLDADRDGKITRAEMDARREQAQERRAERRTEMGAQRGQDAFARLDADHNGQLSPAEFAAGREQMRERRAARGGEHRGGEHRGMGHRGRGMGGEPGERFAGLDADNDGAVSAAELDRAAAQRFAKADANHDGSLTADERRAAWRDRRGPRD